MDSVVMLIYPAKSKSKAIDMTGHRMRNLAKPVNLKLCGSDLPWVDRAEHLGHALHSDIWMFVWMFVCLQQKYKQGVL